MSTTIENGVVKMSFDNSNFERNAKTTMSTLDKLKGMLNMSKTAKSFDEVSKAAKGVNLSPLQNGIQEVHNRFSMLDAVTFTVFSNITNRAMNAGMSLTRAFTIQGALDGFREYEMNINYIQTLMNGTGESLDRVQTKLDELNKYADQTIYSFSDMTANITKFTNQGVSLDDSVSALKGIANWAAYAGAGTQQAAMAMYNLGQALGRGYVMRTDWMSVQNAGMDTQEFKEQCIQSALALGTLTEAEVKNNGVQSLFLDGLSDFGWLTNDVLLTTLHTFTDVNTEIGKKATEAATQIKTLTQLIDTIKESIGTGWADTWRIIIGDIEQSKKLWTPVGNTISGWINGMTNARNEALKAWAAGGGRDAVINGLLNIFKTLKEVLGEVSFAFRQLFPKATAEDLLRISKNFESFTGKVYECLTTSVRGATALYNLEGAFRGLFSVIHIGWQFVTALGRAFIYLIEESGIGDLASAVLEFASALGICAFKMDESIEQNDTFFNGMKHIIDAFLILPRGANAAFKALTGMDFADAISNISTIIMGFTGNLGNLLNKFLEFADGAFGDAVKGITDKLHEFKEALFGSSSTCEIFASIFGALADGLTKAGIAIWNAMQYIAKAFGNAFAGIDADRTMDFFNTGILAGGASSVILKLTHLLDPINDIGDVVQDLKEDLSALRGCLEAFQLNIKADIISKIAKALLEIAAACFILASIDSDRLEMPLKVLIGALSGLVGALAVLQKFNTVSDTFVGSIKGIFDAFSFKIQMSVIQDMAESLLILAVALYVIASALKKMGSMDLEQMAVALIGLTAVLWQMTLVAIALSKFAVGKGKLLSAATALLIISNALVVVAVALKIMGSMDMNQMTTALIGLGVSLGAVTLILSYLADNTKASSIMAAGAAMLMVGNALLALSAALAIIAALDPNRLAGAIAAVSIFLIAVTAALGILGNMEASALKIMAAATAIAIVANALLILSAALQVIGHLGQNEAILSIMVLSVALIAICTALGALSMISAPKLIAASAALLIVAAALTLLTPALVALSLVPVGGLIKALVALAASIAVFAIAAIAVTPVIPAMFALAGALAVLGLSVAAVGAGVFLLATGLALLAVSGIAGAGALVTIVATLVGLVPMIVSGVITAIQLLLRGLVSIRDDIFNAFVAWGVMICDAIITMAPKIAEALIAVLKAALTMLTEVTPMVVDTAFFMFMEFLRGIDENIYQITITVGHIIQQFLIALGEAIPMIIDGAFKLIIGFIEGLGQAIEDNAAALRTAIIHLCEHIINAILIFFGFSGKTAHKMVNTGKDLIKGLINGIGSLIDSVAKKAKAVAKGIKDAFKGMKDKMHEIGGNLMSGLKNGMDWMKKNVWDKAGEIGGGLLNKMKGVLGIHSPSKETFAFGKFLDLGLINGLVSLKDKVFNTASSVGKSTLSSLRDALTDPKSYIDDLDLNPTIKPMLDLSNIQNGARNISRILNGNNISANANIAAREINTAKSAQTASSNAPVSKITNVIFNQTNNSPKPLDRYEIYRDGRNAARQIREAVATT